MSGIQFSSITGRLTALQKKKGFSQLQPSMRYIAKVIAKHDFQDDHASVCLAKDSATLRKINTLVAQKKKLKPEYIVVIGIGGSNLGTIAVQEALLSKHYNTFTQKTPKILYVDTVDSDMIQATIKQVEPTLKKNKNILIVSISKSGGTTETIANTQVFIKLLKKYKKNYEQNFVVISDTGSKYSLKAEELGYDTLPLAQKVGGRYSVFSAVGLFPLAMIGVDIKALLKGVKVANKEGTSGVWKTNYSAQSAVHLAHHAKKGVHIHDTFLFHSDLESLGKWYRQLMGESIGKQHNIKGKEVFAGLTPTVSIGSTDLHSVGQLYLGGPYDKFTTFVSVRATRTHTKVPQTSPLKDLVGHIQSVSMATIMDAILQGTQTAYRKGKRPFATLELEALDAYSIGYVMQCKMLEMMYLGVLLQVNPFDQPNVESYKIVTKKIMEEWS